MVHPENQKITPNTSDNFNVNFVTSKTNLVSLNLILLTSRSKMLTFDLWQKCTIQEKRQWPRKLVADQKKYLDSCGLLHLQFPQINPHGLEWPPRDIPQESCQQSANWHQHLTSLMALSEMQGKRSCKRSFWQVSLSEILDDLSGWPFKIFETVGWYYCIITNIEQPPRFQNIWIINIFPFQRYCP